MANQNYTLNVLIEGYDEKRAEQLNTLDQHDKDWRAVYESRQNHTILQAEITGIENKVYQLNPKKEMLCALVEIGDVRGMIPLEYLGVEDAKQARRMNGDKVAFVVIGLDRENGFFVASRKEALKQMAEQTLKKIKVGGDVLGVVRQVFNNNMYVDIGGIQCSIPSSEASHAWIDSMHDHFKIGDHIKARILEIDTSNNEEPVVRLSIKELLPNPWEKIHEYYKEKGEYVGHVSGTVEFGTYITLRDGVSGLAQHLRHEVVRKGDKVLVRVLKIRQAEQKLNLKIIKVF